MNARVLLHAAIVDYLRRSGCEESAALAEKQWGGSLPTVPGTSRGFLADWWRRFCKEELSGQRRRVAGIHAGGQEQASSPDPPSSVSGLGLVRDCGGGCGDGQARLPRVHSSQEQLSFSRAAQSPSPRLPCLRVESGQGSWQDAGCSPQAGSTAPRLSEAAAGAVEAAAAACKPGADHEPRSSPTPAGLGFAALAFRRAGEQPPPPPQNTLWEDEDLDTDCAPPVIEAPGSPTAGPPASGGWECFGARGSGAAAAGPRGDDGDEDYDDAEQRRLEGRSGWRGAHREASPPQAPGRGRRLHSMASPLAKRRAPLTPPGSSGRGRPTPALRDCDAPPYHDDSETEEDEDGGSGSDGVRSGSPSGPVQRSGRPRPQPGAYARLAQERMRTNGLRRARQVAGPGRGSARRGTAQMQQAQLQLQRQAAKAQQQLQRQMLLTQQRLAAAAAAMATLNRPLAPRPILQLLQQQEQTTPPPTQPQAAAQQPAEVAAAGPAQKQGALEDFPDIPEDLLALDAGCFAELFTGPEAGDDMGIEGWELPAGTDAAPDGSRQPVPCLSDIQGMFDDPLDALLPLPASTAALPW